MGSNVIYLADVRTLNAPSASRPRSQLQSGGAVTAGCGWIAAAHERAAAYQAATPIAMPSQDRPLRVTQLHGPESSPDGGARLRISGRLIDVCAELERLAAAEAMAAKRA